MELILIALQESTIWREFLKYRFTFYVIISRRVFDTSHIFNVWRSAIVDIVCDFDFDFFLFAGILMLEIHRLWYCPIFVIKIDKYPPVWPNSHGYRVERILDLVFRPLKLPLLWVAQTMLVPYRRRRALGCLVKFKLFFLFCTYYCI